MTKRDILGIINQLTEGGCVMWGGTHKVEKITVLVVCQASNIATRRSTMAGPPGPSMADGSRLPSSHPAVADQYWSGRRGERLKKKIKLPYSIDFLAHFIGT